MSEYYIRGDIQTPTNEAVDAKFIADWGNTFPKAAGDVLFGMN